MVLTRNVQRKKHKASQNRDPRMRKIAQGRIYGTVSHHSNQISLAATIFVILRLCNKAAELRHEHLLSDHQRFGLEGYTLLIRDIPEEYQERDRLIALFSRVSPGQVVDVVLHRHVSKLSETHDDQVKARNKLEDAVVTFTKNVMMADAAQAKTAAASNGAEVADLNADPNTAIMPSHSVDVDPNVLHPLRPTHRAWPLFGPRKDSIEFYREQINTLERTLEEKLSNVNDMDEAAASDSAAFVLFADLFAPHVAALANLNDTPGLMGDKHAGVDPEDVIWGNMGMEYFERTIRGVFAGIGYLGLLVSWGAISKSYLNWGQFGWEIEVCHDKQRSLILWGGWTKRMEMGSKWDANDP